MGKETDYKTRILKDIQNTGFPKELEIQSILIQHGWRAENNETYLDKDLEKGREIDVIGYKILHDKKLSLSFHLIIESKQCLKRPWIIFLTNEEFKYISPGWSLLHFSENITHEQLDPSDINDTFNHFDGNNIGTAFHEAFKTQNEPSQIYESLITSCKAAVYQRDLNSWEPENPDKYDPNKEIYLDFFIPIVVFEGDLFKAMLDNKGEIILQETQSVPIKLNYSSKKYEESTFYPRIVKMEGLTDYLSELKDKQEKLFKKILKNLSSL
jgi:hypothetical protein